MGEDNGKVKSDVAVLQEQVKQLEKQIGKVEQKVDDLSENFESRFDTLDRKMALWGGGIAVVIFIIQVLSWFK